MQTLSVQHDHRKFPVKKQLDFEPERPGYSQLQLSRGRGSRDLPLLEPWRARKGVAEHGNARGKQEKYFLRGKEEKLAGFSL